jgi:hypothetical protein
MGLLKDSEMLGRQIRAALQGKNRWVFVTNHPDGHLHMAQIAVALSARWLLLGIDPDKILDFGDCDFFNIPTGHRLRLSFLTVPKSALSVDELNEYMSLVIPGTPTTDGSQDLIIMCEKGDMRAVEGIQMFLFSMDSGKWQAGPC